MDGAQGRGQMEHWTRGLPGARRDFTFSQLALVDRDQADHATERVVPTIERERSQVFLLRRARWRRRDPFDDRLEDRLDAPAGFGADAQDLGRVAAEEVGQLFDGGFSSSVVLDQVPLVDCGGVRQMVSGNV